MLTHLTQKDINEVIKRLNKVAQRQVLESQVVYNTGYPEYLDYKIDKYNRKIFTDFEDNK